MMENAEKRACGQKQRLAAVRPSMPDMTTSAVSHQLRALRTAKLIRSRKAGKNVYYSLNDAHVKDILEKALEHICEK